MSRFKIIKLLPAALAASVLLAARPALGCAACFGQSDSPLASGMNWGIFSLMGVVVFVLGSVAAFFIFLARRASAAAAAESAPSETREEFVASTQKA